MRGPERGFLLLTSHLGDPERRPLTTAQLRMLTDRMRHAPRKQEDRELTLSDLKELGLCSDLAQRALELLGDEKQLDYYLGKGIRHGCLPVTKLNFRYPKLLKDRLGLDTPGVLWTKGNPDFLHTPAIALVGSRELGVPNREFAEAVGYTAAEQGLTLVSGNARGADKTAQDACLRAGGRVISIVADSLLAHREKKNVLYVSEDDFDSEFSAQRALSRNRCIHALGQMVFVAQSGLQTGGTWDGTAKNLRFGWSSVVCFRDGSEASRRLEEMGAYLVGLEDLKDLTALGEAEGNLFTR
ncbi:MAG: DNA-protecting protein DprA [Oscillospiraceae bacterium]|nr:DNA-protecting protein DprA [Oscillospiraceae bacterium]